MFSLPKPSRSRSKGSGREPERPTKGAFLSWPRPDPRELWPVDHASESALLQARSATSAAADGRGCLRMQESAPGSSDCALRAVRAPRPEGHSLKQVSEAGLSQQPSPEQRRDQHEVPVRRSAGSGEAPALHTQEEAPQVCCSSHPLSLYTPLTPRPQTLLRDPQPATTPGIRLPSEPCWHWP